jgi:hypothetical protein
MSNYTGYEEHIDWDAVSGIDLATKPRLLSRWINSPRRRREEREMRTWARRRRSLECHPAEIPAVVPEGLSTLRTKH